MYKPTVLSIGTWSYPATNRLLVQAGIAMGYFVRNPTRVEGVSRTDIALQELSTGLFYNARAGVSLVDYTRRQQFFERFQLARVRLVRHRLAQLQNRRAVAADARNPGYRYQRSAAQLSAAERRSRLGDLFCVAAFCRQPQRRSRPVRAGSMDDPQGRR